MTVGTLPQVKRLQTNSKIADAELRHHESMAERLLRRVERARQLGVEEAEEAWERESERLTRRVRELQEECDRRWSVEEAFTEVQQLLWW